MGAAHPHPKYRINLTNEHIINQSYANYKIYAKSNDQVFAAKISNLNDI